MGCFKFRFGKYAIAKKGKIPGYPWKKVCFRLYKCQVVIKNDGEKFYPETIEVNLK